MTQFIKDAAIQLSGVSQSTSNTEEVAEKIDSLVLQHSLIAAGAAWLPVPGADMVAMTANVWTMYMRINKVVGVKFSENQMKSIGSAVIGNLTANLIAIGAGSLLKFIPGSSLITGAFLTSLVYATNMTAAWVYIRALTKFVARSTGNAADLQSCVDDVLSNTSEIKAVFNDSKSNYKG